MASKHQLTPDTARLVYHHLALAARQQTPLAEVLDILAQDSQLGRRQTRLLRQLVEHHRQHTTLSDALACLPRTFTPQTVALVRHSEQTGCLPLVLDTMSADEQRRQRHQGATRAVLVWPLTILAVLSVLALLVLVFVLPAFQEVFHSLGGGLPPGTLALIGLGDFLANGGWVLLALVYMLLMPRRLNRLSPLASALLWRLYLIIPVVRRFFQRAHAARLAGWLQALHGDRAVLASAVAHLGATAELSLLRTPSQTLAQRLGEQAQISPALEAAWGLPKGLVLAARLGESTGDMGGALLLARELADEQADLAAHRLGRWIFIASYIVAIVLAWWFVAALYLPVFKLGTIV